MSNLLAVFRACLIVIFAVGAAAVARAQEDVIPLSNVPVFGSRGTGTISGKVVLPSGQPVSGRVRISISTVTNPGMTLYTDNSGGFGFTGLGEAVYTIEVQGDPSQYETVAQEVRLIRGTHVRLLINLKERTPTAGSKPVGNVVSLAELEQKVPAPAKKEFERATKLVKDGEIEQAIEHFKKAISLFSEYLMARNDLGVQYLNLKRTAEASEQFEAAIEINPKAFNPRLNMGITRIAQKRYLDAIDQLHQALAIDTSSPAAHLYLGIASVETDDLEAAERELAKAISMGNEDYSVAHFFKAQIHLKRGERDEAISALNYYMEKSPTGEYAARARTLLEQLK